MEVTIINEATRSRDEPVVTIQFESNGELGEVQLTFLEVDGIEGFRGDSTWNEIERSDPHGVKALSELAWSVFRGTCVQLPIRVARPETDE